MVALACADHPQFVPSLAEAGTDCQGTQVIYSVDTVRRFRRNIATDDESLFHCGRRLVPGHLRTWKDYETLLGLCDFIVASRPGFRLDALRLVIPPELLPRRDKSGAKPRTRARSRCSTPAVYLLDSVASHVSATEVRQRLDARQNPFAGLCRRAWRNTLESRLFTGERERFPPPRTALRHRGRAGQTSGRCHAARSERPRRVHRLFLLCTGFSTPQVAAICDEIEEQLSKLGLKLAHREGRGDAEWMLLDYGGFIVHVFTERARHFYDLERLWRSARRIAVPDVEPPPRAASCEQGAVQA